VVSGNQQGSEIWKEKWPGAHVPKWKKEPLNHRKRTLPPNPGESYNFIKGRLTAKGLDGLVKNLNRMQGVGGKGTMESFLHIFCLGIGSEK